MTKVFPNPSAGSVAAAAAAALAKTDDDCCKATADANPLVLTVWKKSLVFSCDGFTVFDSAGNLFYRVDNYISGNRAEIFLMDAFGKPILTLRRKRLSLGDSWLVYDGETADNPRFLVRKNVNILNSKCLAYVRSPRKNVLLYEIEGSYVQRCCAVYDDNRRPVAEIKQKEASVKGVAYGMDIFRLVVQPGFDTAAAMAMVIILDQMFGSSTTRRFLTSQFSRSSTTRRFFTSQLS